ncbi:conserved hypothetical protein [Vibrio phage 501E54-1]|nr:conserved hypothetical protein [Vibrio phage 501E54-1]
MKNNRKIEVGQVRALKTSHSISYEEDLYVILKINPLGNTVLVKFLSSEEDYYTYRRKDVMTDIVVM